ncbi:MULTISPECIES: YbaK/EbsC family protein [Rhodococcus]|jgi:prolyl-tRNA editing enzyme YbaK/EbsC (Cys-tRNA(Pro) deacylase)|uniref:YbaK/EbsC family protein n=1 Tax=Rhodococcus oxybenzonivorans TaxID=1990687 RepID=A0AAE4UYS3_9NOCA|nr:MULTISPECIES: YbaK/EbsC family protein [Rhodococcus]MDV7246648.1 YbaK/EbsC family protein [Rhodococcus oxybenzonivorans]MDV7265066.1 YbaK/EbsC family protein [Rhodococcus oxybenzonivorans]MDV7278271.1 YbaK/EbsC family protein [Rhodococcus oxybenzonivorans]MDV7337660.1 YbaK/EbsC family protein [Rhodococcus oxybenzonivorans]MDV7347974.1 YbaK/EbsC family protein [Rhodococcus oxybenzonivorans]
MPTPLHPHAAHVAETLIARGHHGVIVTQPESIHTADEAAKALGVDIGAITKSLVFLLDDDPILLLVSGAHEVDLANTGKRLQGNLTRAPLEMVRIATGQPIGGIAPLGHPTNLPTYVDNALAKHSELWAAAGHPDTVFRTSFSELVRITAGLAIDVD